MRQPLRSFYMHKNTTKHENYDLLNLLGYGLAKFDNQFIEKFGFSTKSAFFNWFVELELVNTSSVIKNRMDLFDPYFDNGRKGWWQKAEVYTHRKVLIDSLFGGEDVEGYANIVKMSMRERYKIDGLHGVVKPIIKSRFKSLQQTGFEAEAFFINNFERINIFKDGKIEDARLYGDGYDFQVDVGQKSYLAEVKGIKLDHGRFRMTENEFTKAKEYRDNYIITLVMDLENVPSFKIICNPTAILEFHEKEKQSRAVKEYHLANDIVL